MASIIERNGRFLVRVRRRGFPTVTKTFTRRADGLAWARRVEVDMEAGRWQEALVVTPTFLEVIGEYRAIVLPTLKGAATYQYRLEEFAKLPFAQKSVTEVRPADLARWRDEQLALHKPGTVLRKLALMGSIFSWAQRERGWLESNPVAQITKPRAGEGRSRVLSEEEERYLLAAAKTSKATWLADALIVLMRSAMRRGELCGLQWSQLDFENATAFLPDTKNGSSRHVPLCPESLAALGRLTAAAKIRGDTRLIPLGADGSLSTRFKVTLARARLLHERECLECSREPSNGLLSDVRLHDLRHHAVTAWTRSGALSVAELMAISGHKSTRMLVRYTHLKAETVAAKLARLVGRSRD